MVAFIVHTSTLIARQTLSDDWMFFSFEPNANATNKYDA